MNHVQSKPACPRFWALFCTRFLRADEKLTRKLWAVMYPSESQPLLYAISRIEDSGHDLEVLHRFGDVATPRLLIELCARLAPEDGRPRPRSVVQLEERIMEYSGSNGVWA